MRLGYVPAIDGLRCIAILSVLVYHLRPLRLPGGLAGVDLFFVISGFVVTASVARRGFPGFRPLLAYFFARRMIRILPALLAMLLLVGFLTLLFIPQVDEVIQAEPMGLTAFVGASNIFLGFESVDYFAAASGLKPLLHTWTLGVEEQFYLLFPFLYWLSMRGASSGWRLAPVAAASILSLILAIVWPFGTQPAAFPMMPPRFWELGAGMLLFLSMDRWLARLAGARGGLVWGAFLACAAGLAWSFTRGNPDSFPFPGALLPVAAGSGLIALVCARPDAAPARLLRTPPFTFVGRISYSLYLWHWPVFVLLRWTVGLNGKVAGLAALAIAFTAAIASYWLIEQRVRRSSRVASWPRGRVVAVGGAAALLSAILFALLFQAEPMLSLSRFRASGAADDISLAAACPLEEAKETLAGGKVVTLTPRCPRPASAPRLFVVGDSFALAYRPLLRLYASDTGAPVLLLAYPGCEFPPIARPMDRRPFCKRFYRAAIAKLARNLSPGDVLFMTSARLTPINDFWGVQASGGPTDNPRGDGPARRAAEAEAIAALAPLSATGARLVFEAPKPIYRSPPFACMDWFNRNNPVCAKGFTIGRDEMLALRRPSLDGLTNIVRRLPRSSIWDPLPVLCPDDPCNAFAGGRPLYWDATHIGPLANKLLYPDFKRFVLALPPDRAAA
jgi:peptidoglycan/LPS O-acetylase OafA/YrhL